MNALLSNTAIGTLKRLRVSSADTRSFGEVDRRPAPVSSFRWNSITTAALTGPLAADRQPQSALCKSKSRDRISRSKQQFGKRQILSR